ncbi:MAG: efflux RND transporter permease subunit [Prevotellaceae bacterium]|jgi:multidrug efflux pump subunit AcrB/ABC-type multidrug transport system ATPase subunit|nr:efflux RND transporter permease subunit [Prevotellaceae bacterium]
MNFLLDRRITISMLFIALTFLGYVSYRQLPVELLPGVELPVLFVQVSSQQDLDPSYVENKVIIPLEGAISSTGGVENIQSTVDSRQSLIKVEFKKNINFNLTSLRLQEKINDVSATLPEGFSVHVQKVDTRQFSNNFMILQVRGSGGTDRVRNVVDRDIRPDLENIDGIAAVNIYGGREKAIEVQLEPEVCRALNLTPGRISSLLSQNTMEKAFVGFATEPDGKYFVHVNSLYTKVSDLENIVVAPGPILLKDVAEIFFDLKAETSYSRVNGKEAVSVSLTNDSQANLIEVSHRVLEAIKVLNEKLVSHDVEIVVQENSAETMETNINQIIELALVGGLLAIFILWVFLRNIRLVFFIALSIPISVYTAFNFFYAFGISINSLTLVGMALAIGMLLDNSVVVLENIYRLSGTGCSPEHSVTQGTKEVWRSILAATLTTVTVFLPFIFSDNFLVKIMGRHIGVSIISTLSISLFVALLFIPMASYSLLKRKKAKNIFYEKVSVTQRSIQIYLVLLKTCMRNPGTTIFSSVVLLFVTLALAMTFDPRTMKDIESDRFTISVKMETGNTLETTDLAVRVIEDRLEEFPEKEELICRVMEQEAALTFILKKDYRKILKRDIPLIRQEVLRLLHNIRGAEISLGQATGGGGNSGDDALGGLASFMRFLGIGDNRERIVIKGSDIETMRIVAENLRYYIDEQDFIQYSHVSYPSRQPELILNFDPMLLTSYGISHANIAAGIAALNPEISSNASFKVGNEIYDIIIRNIEPEKTGEEQEQNQEQKRKDNTVDDLRRALIRTDNGGAYELDDIADIEHGRGRSQIRRVNRDKQIQVFYAFSRESESSKSLLESYRADIDQLVNRYNLPAGVAVEVFHEEDDFGEFKFLIFAAFILIFIILASVFESVVTPFVLSFSIPLAAIGSLLALVVTGNSLLTANTLIGFLILLGVVVNNSIILIDYAKILQTRGYTRNRSLMTAGLSRVRPILITAVTTIVAMFPLAMGDTEYAGAIGAPFAITVIGGLIFSTLLTLVLVPTACAGLENTLKWYRTLSPKIQLFHLALYIAGIAGIYFNVEGLIWQIINFIALTILIPGATYFAQSSLRRANAKLIDPGENIHIVIRNLVKIYDRPGRFKRQWNSGLFTRRRLQISNEYRRLKDFVNAVWQYALYGFAIYFTYYYLKNKLWIFIFSFIVYAATLYLWRNIRQYLRYRFDNSKLTRLADRFAFWAIPAFVIAGMFRKLGSPNMVSVIAVLWIICLAVYRTSVNLQEKDVKVERAKGRLRRSYYRMVKKIPVLGKRRKPFKALRGVSFEIKTGMFGLLGPNGAGKSTLMRIVCGILEQSYGSIWINGLDTRVYREELQSLIGFLPQEFGTYENMTSLEFMDYQAMLKNISDPIVRRERIEYVLKAVHMYERRNDRIASFSGGMKQRIGIALILLHLPRILIVDEPTAGLDPRERIRFRNLLVELSKERIVIFSTHIIEDISSSCNQVAVINRGELLYFGDPVRMVGMAAGKVWRFCVDKTAFENELDKPRIVHHMQDGDLIQVRYLSAEQPPFEGVTQVEPNLEDAYLCLLKNIHGEVNN